MESVPRYHVYRIYAWTYSWFCVDYVNIKLRVILNFTDFENVVFDSTMCHGQFFCPNDTTTLYTIFGGQDYF